MDLVDAQGILEGLEKSTDDFLSNGFHQFYNEFHYSNEEFNLNEFHDEVVDFELVDSVRFVQTKSDCGALTNFSTNEVTIEEIVLTGDDSSTTNTSDTMIYSNILPGTTITWSDGSYLDLDQIVTEISPESMINLPEMTPLCNESCSYFLKESTENLRYTPESRTESSSSSPAPLGTNTSKPLQCNFDGCGKFYAKPTHLKAHMKRHLNQKPYVCGWPDCKWRFSRSDELARHRRSHLGIKPYKCCFCPKAFARSDHLTKHRRVHEKKFNALNKDLKIQWPPVPRGRPGRKPKAKKETKI